MEGLRRVTHCSTRQCECTLRVCMWVCASALVRACVYTTVCYTLTSVYLVRM